MNIYEPSCSNLYVIIRECYYSLETIISPSSLLELVEMDIATTKDDAME